MDFTAFEQADLGPADVLGESIRNARTRDHTLVAAAPLDTARELANTLFGPDRLAYIRTLHTPHLRDRMIVAAVKQHYPYFDPDGPPNARALLTYDLLTRVVTEA